MTENLSELFFFHLHFSFLHFCLCLFISRDCWERHSITICRRIDLTFLLRTDYQSIEQLRQIIRDWTIETDYQKRKNWAVETKLSEKSRNKQSDCLSKISEEMTRYQIIEKRTRKTDRKRIEDENIKSLRHSIEKHTFFCTVFFDEIYQISWSTVVLSRFLRLFI